MRDGVLQIDLAVKCLKYSQIFQAGMSLTVHDCYRLGFGEPVPVSATTGEGLVDLYQALQPLIDKYDLQPQQVFPGMEETLAIPHLHQAKVGSPIQIASTDAQSVSESMRMVILGQPNVVS
jgi:predicted GTPase